MRITVLIATWLVTKWICPKVNRVLIVLALVCAAASGYGDEARTFCNPLNIDYRFSISVASYREAADPVVVTYGGEYCLFASHSSGYWWSKDFESWNFVKPTGLGIEKFAPAIMVIGTTMYYTSSEAGDLFQTDDPKQGKWTRIGNPHGWDDPALFRDDDGRVFCCFNASPSGLIDGIELDPAKHFAAVGGLFNNLGYGVVRAEGGQMLAARTTSGDSWKKGVLSKRIETGKLIRELAKQPAHTGGKATAVDSASGGGCLAPRHGATMDDSATV